MPGSLGPLDLGGVQIPWHFRCPISLELMRDPVTTVNGQTYDRSSIESWVATGNTTCPVTRAPLTDFTLIPNHTLRRLIQDWCVQHRSFGVERIPTPKQPADPAVVRQLVAQASNAAAQSDTRLASLRRLRFLARESEKSRAVVATRETRSALLAVAFEAGSDEYTIEALGVLAVLSLSEEEGVEVAARPEWLAKLSTILRENHSVEAMISAAVVLEAAAAAGGRGEVGSIDGVMEGIVRFIEERGSHRAVRTGVRALFALCLARENRERAVAAGAVAALVGRLSELSGGEVERALATVELLCRAEGGREAVVAESTRGVRALVRAMDGKASERAAEHAAGTLATVLVGEEALQSDAVSSGLLKQLLLMVQSGCSVRARRKAQVLLKLLRSSWCDESAAAANSDDFLMAF